MLTVREEMCGLDFEKLYRYCPPNKGCSQEDIRRAEARLGVRLDAQYADFLRYANGWREFFGDTGTGYGLGAAGACIPP